DREIAGDALDARKRGQLGGGGEHPARAADVVHAARGDRWDRGGARPIPRWTVVGVGVAAAVDDGRVAGAAVHRGAIRARVHVAGAGYAAGGGARAAVAASARARR